MLLADAIKLINNPFIGRERPSVWADFGAGNGLFSIAIANLLASGSTVYAIDRNKPVVKSGYPDDVSLITLKGDMVATNFNLPPLDGLIAANSLHFIADQQACLKRMFNLCKPGAVFIIVEYDTTDATQWVPYPLPFDALPKLFAPIGLNNVLRLGQVKSVYNASYIYSAVVSS
jgi:ubiquinone/menaquinone biosynthesis C-methylase UbiE